MATSHRLLNEYLWLIDTLLSAGEISKEEIDRRWARSSLNDTGERDYNRRRFIRHKEDIAELFNLDIVYSRTTGCYSISGLDVGSQGVTEWLLSSFSLGNVLNSSPEMRERILFEQIPEGQRFLSTIVDAIRQKSVLRMHYQKFGSPEAHEVLVEPYCLKVYRQRWYMVAKPSEGQTLSGTETHEGEAWMNARVYALDRVRSIEQTDLRFVMPRGFTAKKFFHGYFGVDRREPLPEQPIVFRVTEAAAKYLLSLPLHESQKLVRRKAGHVVFSLNVAPTTDVVQALRMYGPELEVLSPAPLRERLTDEYRTMAERYALDAGH